MDNSNNNCEKVIDKAVKDSIPNSNKKEKEIYSYIANRVKKQFGEGVAESFLNFQAKF